MFRFLTFQMEKTPDPGIMKSATAQLQCLACKNKSYYGKETGQKLVISGPAFRRIKGGKSQAHSGAFACKHKI
jgi:hypothetical protein